MHVSMWGLFAIFSNFPGWVGRYNLLSMFICT